VAFLGQGAAGYAMTTYVMVVAMMFYNPNGYNFFYLVLLPIQLLIAGIVGAVAGVAVWLVGWLLKRRLNILARAAVGIGLATLPVAAFTLSEGVVLEWRTLVALLVGALLALPSALMAGSRFHPLRRIVFGSCRTKAIHDFGSGFSFPPALLLRAVSFFGLIESLLLLVYLVSSRLPWSVGDFGGDYLLETILASLYFAATFLVSLTSSLHKVFLLASTLIVNVLPLILLMNSPPYVDAELNAAALNVLMVVVGTFWLLWALMVFGRLISFDSNRGRREWRLFPLTIWEIEIRQAFGRW
jgi:hypothetical protein